MEARCTCVYAAILLIADVTCEKENQTQLFVRCLDHGNSPINCSSNVTSIKSPDANFSPLPPFQCPDEYELLKRKGTWLQACQPQSCSGKKANATKTCNKFTSTFIKCPKKYLNKDQLEFDGTGKLINKHDNSSVELGDYVIESTRAIICDQNGNDTLVEPPNRIKLPRWCMPMAVTRGKYTKIDGRLFVNSINLYVELFTIDHNETAHVCHYIDSMLTEKCGKRKGRLSGHEFEVLPNWDIRHHKTFLNSKIYPLGTYFLAEDKSYAIICIQPSKPYDKTAISLYVVASFFSALCLLLTILAHLCYPKLNDHTKVLLCLAFSLFVMYITLIVRYLSDRLETAAANLSLFTVHYISTLSAFFWLSILAFDLWRAFVNLRGPTNPGTSSRKKWIFFAKCAYAWGIPTLLCIVAIVLTYSPNTQKHIGLDLDLLTTDWMHDWKTMLIIFYTPIIISMVQNLVLFILTVINLLKASRGTKMVNHNVNKNLFRVYMKLFLVMGLCWLTEIISWLAKHKTGQAAWYVTDVINCLQGVFIFLIYICRKRAFEIIKTRLGCCSSKQIKHPRLEYSRRTNF